MHIKKSLLIIVILMLSISFFLCFTACDDNGNNDNGSENTNISENETGNGEHSHSFLTWSVTTLPSCTAQGVQTRTCSSCGFSEYSQIPALGHTEEVDDAVPATCLVDGKTAGSHCSTCNTVIVAQTTIAASGHSSVIDVAVPPTCTTDGKTEGTHCSVCQEIIQEQIVIPPSHKYVKGVCEVCNERDAISDNDVHYIWYDADMSVIFEEYIEEGQKPTSITLPDDTEKWDYIEWIDGDADNIYCAYRIPQETYFLGNVFQIIVMDLGEVPIATGSAFVFNDQGWFITNAHVMEDAYYAQAIFNIPNNATGESFTYLNINEGTYYHIDKDIYIGKIDNYSTISSYYNDISIDLTYEIGEITYSIGYPHSSTELVIEEGVVTERWSDLYEKLYSGNSYICSSSYIAPGSSGGILTNENLEVIGITTLGWTDKNDNFISGAAISAFNFNNLLQNTNGKDLISLQERFHKNEKVYIGYFNEAKADEANGLTEKFFFEDGSLAYVYEWEDEGVNNNDLAFSTTETLLVGTDGWMSYNGEYYWSDGGRRTISFYGYYDHQKGFDNFKFEFKYEWSDGSYYTVECSNINYSPTIALTLNRCVVNHSYSYTPSDENITYAKEQFNFIYEWLTEDMARFE